MDNIQLDSGESLSFSYKVKYQQSTATTKIDIQDQDLLTMNKRRDTFPGIIINAMDACVKSRWILFNEKIGDKKTYEQVYDDIQKEMDDYNS